MLTAAHCLEDLDASLIDVLVGSHKLSSNARRIQADRSLIHPDYSYFSLDGDLGLLHLSEALTDTTITQFAPARTGPSWTICAARSRGGATWTPTAGLASSPMCCKRLRCRLSAMKPAARPGGCRLADKQICAGYPTMPKAVCSGDSGGPLMIQKPDGQWRQVGIVSAGPYGCVGGSSPDIFTRTAAYTPWIEGCLQTPSGGLHGCGRLRA